MNTADRLASIEAGRIAHDQGWDDAELLDLQAKFLEQKGLMRDFADYLAGVARAENATPSTDES
jgi:hypothetical protein